MNSLSIHETIVNETLESWTIVNETLHNHGLL